MQTKSPTSDQDEINLIDLWLVLMRHKVVIVLALLISVSVAVAYTWRKIPVYVSNAIIQIGQVDSMGYIDDPYLVISRLLSVNKNATGNNEYPKIASVDILNTRRSNRNVEIPNMIAVTAHDRASGGAENYLRQVLDSLISEHAEIFDASTNAKRERYQSLLKQINDIKLQISSLNQLIESLKNDHPVQAAILMLEKSELLRSVPALEDRSDNLQLSLIKLTNQKTKYIELPSASTKPVQSKFTRAVGLSVVFGLLLGVVGAFIAEFLAKARQQATAAQ